MRIVEKLLYGIGGLLALVLFLILLCHLNPGFAENIGKTLYSNAKEAAPEEEQKESQQTEDNPSAQKESGTTGKLVPTDAGLSVLPAERKYEIPAESGLEIPAEVAGRNGYEPVQDTGERIEDTKAEEILTSLGYGDTGEGLTFDALIYPYYQMLNDTGKSLYRQIYANANKLTDAFAPVVTVSASQLKNAFLAVCNDHPELFWLDTAYSYQYTPMGKVAGIYLEFNETADNLEASKTAFEGKAAEILVGAYNLGSDYGREVYIHDSLISQITYDLSAPMNQSAYSALVNGRTVCAGYARAFQYLMQQLNIPCYYCTGYAGENHAWNIIKLENDYYNVDTTWDDTDPNTHDYFNCSDADYAKDHIRKDLSVYLPPCNGEKYRNLMQDSTQDKTPDKTPQETEKPKQEQTSKGETTPVVRLRTLAEAGFQKEQAINNIEDYYADCYNQMLADVDNSISFQNLIASEELWQEIYNAYENSRHEPGYINRVLDRKDVSACTLNVTGERLADGYYLIQHIAILHK